MTFTTTLACLFAFAGCEPMAIDQDLPDAEAPATDENQQPVAPEMNEGANTGDEQTPATAADAGETADNPSITEEDVASESFPIANPADDDVPDRTLTPEQ